MEGVPNVIERATFDPQAALDDPHLVLLDLGHSLVRRLLDVVKDGAFSGRDDRYGRTAVIVTGDVHQTTTLLHLLAQGRLREGDAQRAWLRGIDNLSTASYDVLAATLYHPTVG